MRAGESKKPSPAANDANETSYVHCVVTLAHRHVKLRISAFDSVGSLVELTKAKLHKKYPYEEFVGAVVGIRSTRLDKGTPIRCIERLGSRSNRLSGLTQIFTLAQKLVT